MTVLRYLLPLLAALPIAGCATDRRIGLSPEIEVTRLEALPPPKGEISYRIGPQEVLEIVVVGSKELSGTFLTDQEGHIVYPYIGEVRIGGQSPRIAADLIAEGLRGKFVIDPQVRVIPAEFPPPSISVGGQVKRPGSYPAVGQPTLLTVINNAEGLAEYGEPDDVVVQRTVEGQRYVGIFNIEAIQRGNYPDPRLYPSDVVTVGDSPSRRRFDDVLQILPALANPLVLLIR